MHVILERRHTERVVHPVEQLISVQSAGGAGQEVETECCKRLHATSAAAAGAGCSARKRTSNSVQSSPDRTNCKPPPCNRANSRAKFKPRPCPETLERVPPR